MPSYKFNKPYYNLASEANELTLEEANNVYFEAMPTGGFAIRRRPGLRLIDSKQTKNGQGLYWSDRTQSLFSVCNGSVYRYVANGGTAIDFGSVIGDTLPAVFAEGQKINADLITYIATGGKLDYMDFNLGMMQVPIDIDTPSSTFVACMNNRFYANDIYHDQDFRITDYNPDPAVEVLDALYWSSASNPFRASQKPDPLSGIYSAWNEVYLWGTMACEVWQEDGVTPVSPLVGSIIEAGLAAPYSVVLANNTMFALSTINGKRAVIMLQGRAPQVVSEAIARQLQDIDVVYDAIGSLCFVGGLNLYILTFPTANQTWVYDFKSDTWSQWSQWDLTTAEHNQFLGKFSVYAKDWNSHIVQAADSSIHEISREVFTDNGSPIRSSVRTGWLDHGSWDRKRSNQLLIKLKGYNPTPATLLVRWRDDGFKEWQTAIECNIQANSQNDHYIKLNRMGIYRSRQYEFIMTDAADLALIGMEEDVTKMRN
ncbi:MAG: hypothetical protein JZU65_05630 [Chlorobium sp.]|nr:hypothetical protein [Chlorobium sp.]